MGVALEDSSEDSGILETISHNEPSDVKATTPLDEKHPDIEVASTGPDSDFDDAAKIYVPEDNEDVIDPRLKDYPVPLVAKTVDLHNDFK